MGKFIDLSGKKFGRLLVIRRTPNRTHGNTLWECHCECGGRVITSSGGLNNGHTQSCGCLRKERLAQTITTHGHTKAGSNSPEYHTWKHMKSRCFNPKATGFSLYGGRGITVCERWHKFENFLADMGERPKGKTLDRIDNSKGYSKENCRWATQKEQTNNTNRNRYFNFNGYMVSFQKLLFFSKVPADTLYGRLTKLRWTVRKAMITPRFKKREVVI